MGAFGLIRRHPLSILGTMRGPFGSSSRGTSASRTVRHLVLALGFCALAASAVFAQRIWTGGGRFYRVTGAGVRAVCPDARAAVYLTGEDVTVFTSDTGRHRMRWDGPDKGRFAQGGVYRVSAHAVKFKEAT